MDEYMSSVRVWGLTCPGLPEEIGRARRWVRDILGERECTDDAALIVSELGTNALRYSASGSPQGSFNVTIAASDRALTISVTDDGHSATTPEIQHPDDDATQGRGLVLVYALASNVQMRSNRAGRTVTAELALPAHRTPLQECTVNGPTVRVVSSPVAASYRCECWIQDQTTSEPPVRLSSFEAPSPDQAVDWVRAALRAMAPVLERHELDRAWNWISQGYQADIEALAQNRPCTVTIKQAYAHVEWTISPEPMRVDGHDGDEALGAIDRIGLNPQLAAGQLQPSE